MSAPATPSVTTTIPLIGTCSPLIQLCIAHGLGRIPDNCAHSSPQALTCSRPPILPHLPRPYTQLNSGTLVCRPSKQSFDAILRVLDSEDIVKDFSFPDQDLLAYVFRGKWVPLAWYYNALQTLPLAHPRLWNDSLVRCVHYITPEKPWVSSASSGLHPSFLTVHEWWWESFDKMLPTLMEVDMKCAQWVLEHVNRR